MKCQLTSNGRHRQPMLSLAVYNFFVWVCAAAGRRRQGWWRAGDCGDLLAMEWTVEYKQDVFRHCQNEEDCFTPSHTHHQFTMM
ncbi:MAG: hypothetical protein KDC93_14385 [Cyclobacteriaceae bacterium]|nr:hypothetical protein [Cyclobacteriaceae bacterium]